MPDYRLSFISNRYPTVPSFPVNIYLLIYIAEYVEQTGSERKITAEQRSCNQMADLGDCGRRLGCCR